MSPAISVAISLMQSPVSVPASASLYSLCAGHPKKKERKDRMRWGAVCCVSTSSSVYRRCLGSTQDKHALTCVESPPPTTREVIGIELGHQITNCRGTSSRSGTALPAGSLHEKRKKKKPSEKTRIVTRWQRCII
jgi:hypothetical protein